MFSKYLPSVFAYAQLYIKFQTRASLHPASLHPRQKICVELLPDRVDFSWNSTVYCHKFRRKNEKGTKTKGLLAALGKIKGTRKATKNMLGRAEKQLVVIHFGWL